MVSALPEALRPAARSAYRAVMRSARITFQGDASRHAALLTALRTTFSSPTLSSPSQPTPAPSLEQPADAQVDLASETEISKRIQEWNEVAMWLRRNVVQGVQEGQEGAYRLRVTEHTELGDNATIKSPPKLPTTPFPNRGKRRRGSQAVQAAEESASAASS